MMKKFFFFCCMLFMFTTLGFSQTVITEIDFETATDDADWSFVNGSNGWYIGSATDVNNTASGSRGIYISSDAGTSNTYTSTTSDSWAYVDVAIPTGYAELLFEFDWKCYGESSFDYMKVYVGAASTPSGSVQPANTMVLINSLNTSYPNYFNGYTGSGYTLNSGWNHYSTTIPASSYAGQTVRLYLYWHNDGSVNNNPPMAIDDIVLTGSSCGSVTNISANTSSTDATITITPALSTDAAWEYVCVTSGSDISNETPIAISTTSFDVTNLIANTLYDIYVRTDCGTESSNWAMVSFRTACASITTFPYSEFFDSYGSGSTNYYPTCWSRYTTYSANYPYISSTNYSAPGSLYFYTSGTTYCIGSTDPIDASIPLSSLQVSFMMRASASTYKARIGVISDPNDITTFDEIAVISPSDINVWEEFEIPLSNYTGNGSRIAIVSDERTANLTNYFYIDNFSIDYIPSCPRPAFIELTSVDGSSASISWTAGSESEWLFAYGAPGQVDTANATTIYTNPYTILGLSPNTSYEVYIKAVCAQGDQSRWSRKFNFMTTSLAPAQLPYSCDFEDEIENAEWVLINGTQANQWFIGSAVNNTTDGDSALYISNDNGVSNNYNTGSTSYVWAYRDIIFTPAAEYELSFDWHGVGESSLDNINVYLGDPGIVTAGSTAVPSGATAVTSYLNQSATWSTKLIYLNSSNAGTKRLYFLWKNDSSVGTMPGGAVDNISITPLSCGRPYDVLLDSVSTDYAYVEWTSADAGDSEWQVVYGPSGFNPSNETPTTVYSPFIELNSLTPATAYQVYVRTVCSDGTSGWSNVINFRTECPEFMEVPYNENFDTYGVSGTAYFPTCWTRLTNYSTNYPYISSSYNTSSPGALYFYATTTYYSMAVAPAIDTNINPINTLSVSFQIRKTSTTTTYGRCEIGVLANPNDASTFTTIATILPTDLAAASTWYEMEVPLTSFTGSGCHIALRAPAIGTNYFYLDDFSIFTTPTCLRPTDVELSQISSNSVTVDWDPRNNETAWEVVVVPNGGDPNMGTPEYASAHPYTVMGLTDNTEYDVYVRSDCGGDYSNWTTVQNFHTACLPTSIIPYTEDFSTATSGSTGLMPNCWQKFTNYTTAYPYASSSYTSSSPYSMYFYSTSTYYSYMVSQGLDLSQYPGGTLLLSCKTLSTSTSYGRLNIGYMTDPSDLSTFTLLKAVYPSDYSATSTWFTREVVIPQEITETVYLAFVSPMGGTNYIYVDDISLDFVPDCSQPTELEISHIAGTSALVSWTASPFGANNYTVEFSEAGLGNWTMVGPVNGTSTLIPGLLPQTTYDVQVSANCDNAASAYLTGSFTTGCLSGGELGIGNGTTTQYYVPLNNFYNYTYTQQIFDASEMNGASQIRGIKFQYAYASPSVAKNNVTIYLAHTTTSTFTSTTSWIDIDSATLVYTGNLNCTQGWNTFNFTTPFNYNGTDNLVLIVDDNSGDYDGSTYTFYAHSAPNKSLHEYDDSTNPDPNNPPSGIVYSNRSNVIWLADCDSIATCVAPNVIITEVNDQSVTIEWAPGNNESSWELEYKLATESTWTSEGTVSVSPYIISGLTSESDYQVRIRSNCGSDYSEWVVLSFSTECPIVTTLPLLENFDSAPGSGAGNFVDCWYRGTNYSTAYPYTSSTQSFSSPYSVYFYASTSYYSYAVSPRLDDSIVMDSLQVSFQMYKTSAAYFIEVGIMSDPTDFSTFVPISTATPTTTATWELGEINTDNYTGNGHYVAFRVPSWVSNYMYIDDISIQYIPNCVRIEDLEADNILANQADIEWTAGSDETTWEYLYGPTGTVDFDVDVPLIVTTNSVQLTGLIANTQYEVFVRGICQNGEYSAWTVAYFRTACDEILTLPFYESFDTYGTGSAIYPQCWAKINTYSSDRPYINTTNYSSPGALYFYAGTSGTYNIAVFPPFTSSIAISGLQLSLQYRTLYASDKLIVGVMTSATDASTFVPVDTLSNTSTSSWVEHRVLFENYTGSGQFIALKNQYTTTYCYAYVDDIEVDLAPSCDDPTAFNVTNLTGSSADLTWQDAAGESSWQLLIVEEGQPVDFTQAQTVSTSTYSATSLSANTIYNVYLRTVCSNGLGYSNWIQNTFMTISNAPAQTPYLHDFDNGIENAEWAILNATCTNKWYIGNPVGETDSLLFVSTNGTTNDYNISSTSNVWAYRDIQFGNGAEFNLSIQWRNYGESCCDYMRIYIGNPMPVTPGTTLVEPDNATLLSGNLNLSSNWTTENYVLDGSYANSIKRLYIMWHNDGSLGTTPSGSIDTIQITVSDCGRPYDVLVSNIATTSADATFSPAMTTDNAWQYVAVPTGSSPDAATPVDITSTTFQITGLTASTSYSLYVRTACSLGGYSAWSEVTTFFTLCDAVAIPYTENFDVYGTGSTSYFPQCWSRITTYSSNYPYISGSYSVSSPGSLYFYAGTTGTYNLAITPQIDVTTNPMNTLQVSFQFRQSNATSRIIVGVMTDNTNANTFVPIDTVSGTTSVWNEYTVLLNGYTGTGSFIAFKCDYTTTTGYGYFDNVFVETIPTCPRPSSISNTATTSTSATISWAAAGSETSWNIIYGPAGFDPASAGTTVPTTTNPTTISNLTSGTTYDFYVQADCGSGDLSLLRGPLAVTPGSINMPTSGSITVTMCDGMIYDDGGVNASYSNSCSGYIIINPATVGGMVSIQGTYLGEGCCDYLTIYDGAGLSGTQLCHLIGNASSPIAVGPFTSTSGPLTVQFTSDGSVTYGGFALTTSCVGGSGSSCDAPTNVMASNVGMNSATVVWTAGGDETEWIVEYKTASASTYTVVNNVTTVSHQLANLTANTTYNVRVKAVCDANTESDYSTVYTFTTSDCSAPTNLTSINLTSNSVILSWTAGGNESSWILEYKRSVDENYTSINTSTNPHEIINLLVNTTYNVRVKAVCSENNQSSYSSIYTFTTPTEGATYTITATAGMGGNINPSGSVTVPHGTNQTFTITPDPSYSVSSVFVDGDNLGNITTYTFINVVADHVIEAQFGLGIEEYNSNDNIILYPNPTQNFIEIRVQNNGLTINQAAIYDVYGKLISTEQIDNNKATINVHDFASGVYFIRIETNNGIITKKFVKE